MPVDSLTSATNSAAQYQLGMVGAARGNALQEPSASRSATSVNPDQATSSHAARAQYAQYAGAVGVQSASPDIVQEEQLLTTLTDNSLAALGIVSAAGESGTRVTFDSVSYNVLSSTSVSVSQPTQQSNPQVQNGGILSSESSPSSTQLSNVQDATFTGEGHVVTADGRNFEFQIELQVGQSQQGSSNIGGSNAESAPSASCSGNIPLRQHRATDLANRSLDAAGQISAASNSGGANPQSNSRLDLGEGQASQSGTSPTAINWDAILNQTKTLFDLLESLGSP